MISWCKDFKPYWSACCWGSQYWNKSDASLIGYIWGLWNEVLYQHYIVVQQHSEVLGIKYNWLPLTMHACLLTMNPIVEHELVMLSHTLKSTIYALFVKGVDRSSFAQERSCSPDQLRSLMFWMSASNAVSFFPVSSSTWLSASCKPLA